MYIIKYKLVWFEMYLKYDEYGYVKYENMCKNYDNWKKKICLKFCKIVLLVM